MSTPRKPRKQTRQQLAKESDQQHQEFVQWTLQYWARKFRDDSLWKRLEPGQCERLESWMFEENQTYVVTVERVKQEFGIETSVNSLARLYRELALIRQSFDLFNADRASTKMNDIFGNTDEMRRATVKLLAKSAVNLATDQPEQVERLMPLAKLLLSSEENDIRLRRVKLEEQQFDFQAGLLNQKHVEKVRAYLQSIENNQFLTAEEKEERLQEVKEDLFGPDKPAAGSKDEEDPVEKLRQLIDGGKKPGKAGAGEELDQSEKDYIASEQNGGGKSGDARAEEAGNGADNTG